LYHANRRNGEEYDLGDDLFSQMYGGINHEDPRCQDAVDATKGLVIRYQGDLIPAYFHSASGGHTADADEVWVRSEPFLVGKEDPYSAGTPQHDWEFSLTEWQLGERLQRYNVGRVRELNIVERGASGRIKRIQVAGSRRTVTLSGNAFRLAVGPSDLKSTLLVSLDHQQGQFFFRGHGWGHGVGMSQWSAKIMAEQGWSASAILKFFYTNVDIAY